ncbi:hypothetical protein [Pedobacter chinensis]|uniref:hypothetical protein n=1 Tax=Pedobacter chinensis TaxID=2282421 RepID=UPI001314511A|nr:hypothetical protein [Pedobacter chinensis]
MNRHCEEERRSNLLTIVIPIAALERLLHSSAHTFSSVRNDGSLNKVYLKL